MVKRISGQELRTARAALGLSRESLAACVGISGQTVKHIETGIVIRGKPYQASVDLSAKLIAFFESQGVEFLPDKKGRLFGLDVSERGEGS